MRKIAKISVILLIGCLILSPVIVSGNYQVSIGETYTYDVNNAEYEVSKGAYTAYGNGFQINDHQFPNNTTVEAKVVNVDPATEVAFQISSGGQGEVWFSNALDALGVALLVFLPILEYDVIGTMVFNDINSTVSKGTGILMPVFWDTASFDFFDDLTSESYISDITTEPEFQDLDIYAEYEEVGSEMIFDWYLIGSMDVTATYTQDYEVEHQVKMVYDLATGVLQGIRVISTATGTHSGQSLDYYMDYFAELQGYDLADFLYGPSTPTPTIPSTPPTSTIGFGWIAILLAGSILLIPIILRKMRK